jgi:three-Cys-motif partner protein
MRDLPDDPDDPDGRWILSEHTLAKHEILRRYLGAWLSILGNRPLLVLFDGFAGRGRYRCGEPGSPQIMFHRAVEVAESGRAERVWVRCAEPDPKNFGYLNDVCGGLKHDRVQIVPRQEKFVEAASSLADWAEKQHPPPPIFVMVDPYGFSDVPLSTIERLLRIPRLEVLVTFMVRDMNRFLELPQCEPDLTEFFGGAAWRDCSEQHNRSECLLMKYRQVVVPGVAKYAIPFRVFEDERRTVLYYLVHLTNNDLGMRRMKEAMVAKSGDMTFWPVTVRPPDQLALEVEETRPFPSLQRHLVARYAGRELTFLTLLNEDYPEGIWVETHYRAALEALSKSDPPAVRITRTRLTKSGKTATRGIQASDLLHFI